MVGLLPTIFISLFIFQTCYGVTIDSIRHLLEEKVEDLLQELVKPVITEMSTLNRTLLFIEKDLNKRKLTNRYLSIFMNTEANENYENDNICRNLPVYLPKAKQIIENAFYMCTEVTGSLSDVIADGLKCLDINILKTIPCLLRDIGKTLVVYKKYKPEILPIILELKKTLTLVYEMYRDCIKLL
uniref:Putative secreted protein n=1 Tax=Panstrongylus lignarius TaxID=156445 RepID=A0A224XLL1_9HEMI